MEIPRQIGTEEVGVLVPWTPPDDPLHVTSATAHAILTVIDSRWKNATPFSKKGDRSWLRWIMADHGLTRLSAKNLIRQWDENGVTDYQVYDNKLKSAGYRVLKWPGRAE